MIVSYNDEAWVTLDELREMCSVHGDVVALAFDSRRYVGALIGIHNPAGEKVGTVSHTRNQEYVRDRRRRRHGAATWRRRSPTHSCDRLRVAGDRSATTSRDESTPP